MCKYAKQPNMQLQSNNTNPRKKPLNIEETFREKNK